MKIDQFKREKGYQFQVYALDGEIETDIGEFDVEILIMDDSPLTQELVDLATSLSESGKRNTKEILDIIYKSYLGSDEDDLSIDQVMEQVDSQCFVVAKDPESDRVIDCYVYIRPEWDEEHALYIRCEADVLTVFDPMAD